MIEASCKQCHTKNRGRSLVTGRIYFVVLLWLPLCVPVVSALSVTFTILTTFPILHYSSTTKLNELSCLFLLRSSCLFPACQIHFPEPLYRLLQHRHRIQSLTGCRRSLADDHLPRLLILPKRLYQGKEVGSQLSQNQVDRRQPLPQVADTSIPQHSTGSWLGVRRTISTRQK